VLEQSVDARKGGSGTAELVFSAVAAQAHLTPSQTGPETCSVDHHSPFCHHIGEEDLVGLGVLEPYEIDLPTEGGRELVTQIDDSLEARIAQIDD